MAQGECNNNNNINSSSHTLLTLAYVQDVAEFGHIGRYYAMESMLLWDPVKQVHNSKFYNFKPGNGGAPHHVVYDVTGRMHVRYRHS